MSTNFDFLRNFDNDLHYLACIIEDEIYESPSAVLTDATTFMEIIVYEIFKKYDLKMESLHYFSDKISALSMAGFLSADLKKYLLKAYSIRNKMHSYNGDAKNHIQLNQMRAIHIHKLLFNVAWLYYSENCEEQFKVPKPSYTHPSKIKSDLLISSEISNGKCIICENKTKTEDETFCSECKYKIEKCDNLKTLRKHFGFEKGFKRNDIIEMGFEKGYVGPFLQELKNEDLISSVGKLNKIDREKSNQYISEVESMLAVEKLLSDYKLRNIDLNEILNHEFYKLGKENQYPFVGMYHLFSEIFYSKFIEKIDSDDTIEETLNASYLTDEELTEWFLIQKNQKSGEYYIFCEKVINEIFAYEKEGLNINEIKSKLNLNETIFKEIEADTELYQQKKDEYIFSLFLRKTMQEKVTKKQALNETGLTEKMLDNLLSKYPDFQAKYTKSYTSRRMEKFLKHYDYLNYQYALKRIGLMQEEIDDWLSKGKKMIKYDEDNMFSKFYIEYNKLSAKKYVEYRMKGKTRHKASKKIHMDANGINQLLNQNEQYKIELETFLVNGAREGFKVGKTKETIIKELDVNLTWLNNALDKGKDSEELYVGLYQKYESNAIPNQINEFLKLIKTKELKNVLKELNINENELDSWYEKGRDGDELFKKFYEEFFEYKKETYIKTMIKTKSKQKALTKSRFTEDELKMLEDDFEKEIFEKSMEIVKIELKKGKTTKQAAKKASVKISDIYSWVEKGLDKNEDYEEFLEVFDEEYLLPIKKVYEDGVKEGVNEKNIVRTLKRNNFLVNDDVKYLKRLDLYPKREDVVLEMDEDFEIDLDKE